MSVLDYIENCFLQVSNPTQHLPIEHSESFVEEEVISQFLVYLKKKMRLAIVKWQPLKDGYPTYMFLSGDKGILAYIDFKYLESSNDFSNEILERDSNVLLKTIRYADSQLDRPVFFVYMLKCKDKQGIFFETNEQIKDRWFNEPCFSIVYRPVFEEMGELKNLIFIWNDLKKNNVRT